MKVSVVPAKILVENIFKNVTNHEETIENGRFEVSVTKNLKHNFESIKLRNKKNKNKIYQIFKNYQKKDI